MQKKANRVSLGAVHTHTHTHTCISREIKRVASEATLYCVENRLFVALLFERKNKVLEIACFLHGILLDRILKKFYTVLKFENKLANQGGVE